MKMKNKKEEQRKERERRKQERRKSKKNNRLKPSKNEKERFLIVCEGKLTEPSYFNQFKLSSATIRCLGDGKNTLSVVEQAIKLVEETKELNKEAYDQIWCVFDKDGFPSDKFDNAIHKAKSNNFHIAYSNQAFEYWFILHFEDHQGGAMKRDDYYDKLNSYLKDYGLHYDKDSKKVSEAFFELMMSKLEGGKIRRVDRACKRAERNLKVHIDVTPAKAESSTTVFKLVQEIERFK